MLDFPATLTPAPGGLSKSLALAAELAAKRKPHRAKVEDAILGIPEPPPPAEQVVPLPDAAEHPPEAPPGEEPAIESPQKPAKKRLSVTLPPELPKHDTEKDTAQVSLTGCSFRCCPPPPK